MSETTTETVQDNVQEVATNSQEQVTESPDVGNLIAESKKYRTRAQEAESKLAELQSSLEKKKEEELAKQNKWEELATKRQSELDLIKTDYERLKGAEEAYKEELLNSLGEEERETFKDLSVSQLRTLSEKLKIEVQEKVPDTSSTPSATVNTNNKSWVDMSNEERRANWGAILQSYVKR
jgi:DNA repair exonuclease SbcCD ATPase subunit|tara:strand:+ start:145 stop:684 length:540 start_codon:yes stop_codon:yes gene_type:complete